MSSKTIGERRRTQTLVEEDLILDRLLSRIAAWDNGWKGSDSAMQYSYQRDQDSMSDISVAASSYAPSFKAPSQR
jgi:hypothetical protein